MCSAQMTSPIGWPFYKSSVRGHNTVTYSAPFQVQSGGLDPNKLSTKFSPTVLKKAPRSLSLCQEGKSLFTAKGILEHLCSQRAPTVTDWAPDLLNGSIYLLLHSNSHMHQQKPKSHTAYSTPGQGARLGTTLTSIQDIFPWKSPSLPSWGWLSASHWAPPAQPPGHCRGHSWMSSHVLLGHMGGSASSWQIQTPATCSRAPLCAQPLGLSRSLVLQQPHLLGGSSRCRVRHKAMLGWKLWMCAAPPGSVAHCS